MAVNTRPHDTIRHSQTMLMPTLYPAGLLPTARRPHSYCIEQPSPWTYASLHSARCRMNLCILNARCNAMGVAAGFTVGDHRTFNAQVAWTTKVDTMLERCRVSHTAFAVSISQSFHEARFHETSIAMRLVSGCAPIRMRSPSGGPVYRTSHPVREDSGSSDCHALFVALWGRCDRGDAEDQVVYDSALV